MRLSPAAIVVSSPLCAGNHYLTSPLRRHGIWPVSPTPRFTSRSLQKEKRTPLPPSTPCSPRICHRASTSPGPRPAPSRPFFPGSTGDDVFSEVIRQVFHDPLLSPYPIQPFLFSNKTPFHLEGLVSALSSLSRILVLFSPSRRPFFFFDFQLGHCAPLLFTPYK